MHPDKVNCMRENRQVHTQNRNVKIDLPESLNDPKFERSDLAFMTDDYRHSIGK
jgi:hypothetical protein